MREKGGEREEENRGRGMKVEKGKRGIIEEKGGGRRERGEKDDQE